MAKKVNLTWTDLQKQIANAAEEGKTFDELVEAGFSKSVVSKVLNAIKAGQKLPDREEPRTENREPKGGKREPKGGGQEPRSSKSGTQTSPVTVGKITITPENWGFTQYGAILVLDTYNKAKRDINYGGTVGDFLCDMCEFYRRIVNYKEVEYVREAGDGGGSAEEDGRASSGQAIELTGPEPE